MSQPDRSTPSGGPGASTSITIDDGVWNEEGEYLDDPRARLTATIDVILRSEAGETSVVPMQLEAYAVVYTTPDGRIVDPFDATGNQRDDADPHAIDDDADEALEKVCGDGRFPSPVTIAGREYLLIATPL